MPDIVLPKTCFQLVRVAASGCGGAPAVGASEKCTVHALPEVVARHHEHTTGSNQCCSTVVQRVSAPVDTVWSVVRRFDKPQAYKHFVKSCQVIDGDGAVGTLREVRIVSGLPAETSTERLEILDSATSSASGSSAASTASPTTAQSPPSTRLRRKMAGASPAPTGQWSWSRTSLTCRRGTRGKTRVCSSIPSSGATSSPSRALLRPSSGAARRQPASAPQWRPPAPP